MGIEGAPVSTTTTTMAATTTTITKLTVAAAAATLPARANELSGDLEIGRLQQQANYLKKKQAVVRVYSREESAHSDTIASKSSPLSSSSTGHSGQPATMAAEATSGEQQTTARSRNGTKSGTTSARLGAKSLLTSFRPAMLLLVAATCVTVPSSLAIECYCQGECSEHRQNQTCVIDHPEAMCFHHVQEVFNDLTNQMEIESSYGCLGDQAATLTCKGHLTKHKAPMNIKCCSNANMCNVHLKMDVIRHESDHVEEGLYTDYTHPVIFLLALTMCSMVAGIVYLFYRLRRKRLESSSTENEHFLSNGSKSLQELIECSITSGSGSGLPKMVQRTIARQIELNCSIGKGRYGEVFRASWKGDYVACKVFNSTEEASWCRETEIYQTTLLRHDHILGFIAADIRGHRGVTQLLLITNYHENGSLYDYLMNNGLDEEQAVEMALTACSGLFYLHTPILGKQAKPAIAHRDIKSKNILVKRDGTCCIADFGLAVRADMHTSLIDIGGNQNIRVGTKRYMAPEVLDETLTTSNFNSYLRADMYSFGLVLWEIASRITLPGVDKPEQYRIPYHDSVPADPTFDEMRKVVCISKDRPRIPETWNKSETTQNLASVIRELWGHEPRSRLTVLRAKKSLAKVEDTLATKQRYSPSNQQDIHIIPPV